MIYREKPTKKIEYRKIFNKFSHKSYMRMARKFLKRAERHFKHKLFDRDVKLNIFTANKDPKAGYQEFNSLSDITKEVFDNSRVIKVHMTSVTKMNDCITSYYNSNAPKKISLTVPEKKKKAELFIF